MSKSEIEIYSFVKKGSHNPFHRHRWTSLAQHPDGGRAIAAFMLEDNEAQQCEMCLTCNARRIKQ